MFFYLHELNTRKGATVNGPESSANLFHRAFAFSGLPFDAERSGMDQLRIETYRETIGGVDVVDAAYADRLLNAAAKVMRRHGEWRAAIEACRTEDTKPNRNKANSARGNYRRARYECGVVIDEARVKLE